MRDVDDVLSMGATRVRTDRLELRPLPPAAAAALPGDRVRAAALIGATLSADWPGVDLLDVLPMQASASPEAARFGVWLIVEQASSAVVGDIGFFGPPGADATVEIGYSIVPGRRRRGYATEAASALVSWALALPEVDAVIACCDAVNDASVRTLERAGFARAGANGDRLLWRLS